MGPALPIILGIALIFWAIPKEKKRKSIPRSNNSAENIEQRGVIAGKKVIVLGRTGAGKSSLINMLAGSAIMQVGPVSSITRWFEGVQVEIAGKSVILVDSPGYGEAITATDYASGIHKWIRDNIDELSLLLFVIQADSKAHSEDKQLMDRLKKEHKNIPVAITLSQVDKLHPLREPLSESEWDTSKLSSTKSKNIARKIREICTQFNVDSSCVVPAAVTESMFNRNHVLKLIEKRMQ
jgi:small GTP-binding protein